VGKRNFPHKASIPHSAHHQRKTFHIRYCLQTHTHTHITTAIAALPQTPTCVWEGNGKWERGGQEGRGGKGMPSYRVIAAKEGLYAIMLSICLFDCSFIRLSPLPRVSRMLPSL